MLFFKILILGVSDILPLNKLHKHTDTCKEIKVSIFSEIKFFVYIININNSAIFLMPLIFIASSLRPQTLSFNKNDIFVLTFNYEATARPSSPKN